jgi:hypothetical protein
VPPPLQLEQPEQSGVPLPPEEGGGLMVETSEISSLVRQQIEEIFSDPVTRQRYIGNTLFGPDQQDTLDKHEGVINSVLNDSSFGRILNGPLWLSGASVVSGTITADKIVVNSLESITVNTGSLNVTGDIVASPTYPAVGARIVMNSTALTGYSSGVNTTFILRTDGSGEIGTGANKITWTTGGVVSIPAAVITSLTIGINNVTSGVLGGTYSSAAANPRFQMSPTELGAFSAGGAQTFQLLSSTGAVTMTGSFTVRSATSGARVVLDNAGGIEGFNASGTSTFRFNAATGAGYVGGTGSGTNGISWDSAGTVSIGGSAFSGGKITATSLSVSTLSSIQANMGNLTAGTITGGTITASLINAGTLTFNAGGTINGGGASVTGTIGNTGGTMNLGKLTITDTLLLSGASAKIQDGDGSTWDQTGITLISSGSFGDAIKWKTSSTNIASIYCNLSNFAVEATGWGSLTFSATSAGLFGPSGSAWGSIRIDSSSGTPGVQTNGRFYPGYGNNNRQTIYYIDGANIQSNGIGIGGMLGISSGNTINFVAPGTGGSASNWSTWDASQTVSSGWFNIQIAGTNYRVPFFANA